MTELDPQVIDLAVSIEAYLEIRQGVDDLKAIYEKWGIKWSVLAEVSTASLVWTELFGSKMWANE